MKGVDDVCGRVIRLLMGERKKRTRGGPGAKRKRPKGLTPASADTSVMFHPDGFSLFLCLFWPTLLFLWIQFDKRKPLFFSTTPKNDEWVLNTTVDAIHPKPPTWLVDNPRDKEYTEKKCFFFFFRWSPYFSQNNSQSLFEQTRTPPYGLFSAGREKSTGRRASWRPVTGAGERKEENVVGKRRNDSSFSSDGKKKKRQLTNP